MIIIGARSYKVEEALQNVPADLAPNLWIHRRGMKLLSTLNAIDRETFMAMRRANLPFTKNMRWISHFNLADATIINHHYPDVFEDRSGKAAQKFLARNPQYAVERP